MLNGAEIESPRTRVALVSNLAVSIDNIDSVGGCRIRLFRCIVHAVDQHWHGDIQPQLAGLGYINPLLLSLGLRKNDTLFFVGRNLPAVARVGFADVYYKKLGPVFIAFVNRL